MKTKALIACILIFSSSLVNAQYHGRKFSVAVGFEPHLNWIHADESRLAAGPVRAGISGGIRLDYRFQRSFAFSTGINWNQTGGNIIYSESILLDLPSGLDTLRAGTRVTYRMQFVEIPVALKLILPEIGYSTWFAEAGIDPMFLSKGYINATDNNIQKVPFQNGMSKFNLAWHTGLGMNYSLGGALSLQVELIYKNTFLDVTTENNIRKPDNSRINQVGLNIGIAF